jgi:hypothetical protein
MESHIFLDFFWFFFLWIMDVWIVWFYDMDCMILLYLGMMSIYIFLGSVRGITALGK